MNVSCEVIQDLLPIYHDKVCSPDTKSLVEQHLTGCQECQLELGDMDQAVPALAVEQNLNEAKAVQQLARTWKRTMWKSVAKGAAITLAVITAAFLIASIFAGFRVVY